MKTLLGIDIGSTGCKAVLYDLNGNIKGAGYRSYPMETPQIGWVEEDADKWWDLLCEAIGDCISGEHKDIIAIAISGTNALVAIGENGNVLYPAIMQMDTRSESIAEELNEKIGSDHVFSITGNRIAPGMYAVPSMLWLKRNKQEVYSRVWKFLSPNGFISYRFTGEAVMDYSRCCSTMLFDIREKKWSQELIKCVEIDDAKLPLAVPSEKIIGTVNKFASEQTGIPVGVPVIAGAQDTVTAAIGAGCINPGKSLLVVGTVARICLPLENDRFHISLTNRTFLSETPYMVSGGTNGGGLSMRWFVDTFGEAVRNKAIEIGQSPYELIDKLAAQTPKGSEGLVYLPYIAAERSPIWDPKAKGVFFGITQRHKIGHFARAIMEGVAFAVRQCMDLLEEDSDCISDEIRILGGGAKSSLWRQIFADVLEKKITALKDTDTETKGAAFMAGLSVGVFSSYEQIENWIETSATAYTDNSAVEMYRRTNKKFCKLYPILKDEMHK